MPADDISRSELRALVQDAVRAELRAAVRRLAATVVAAAAAWWGLLLVAGGLGADWPRRLLPTGLGVVLFVAGALLLWSTWELWPYRRGGRSEAG